MASRRGRNIEAGSRLGWRYFKVGYRPSQGYDGRGRSTGSSARAGRGTEEMVVRGQCSLENLFFLYFWPTKFTRRLVKQKYYNCKDFGAYIRCDSEVLLDRPVLCRNLALRMHFQLFFAPCPPPNEVRERERGFSLNWFGALPSGYF